MRIPIGCARHSAGWGSSDPYVELWHALVAPLLRSGSIGLANPAKIFQRAIAPRLDDHMGGVFERICREHARASSVPFEPFRIGSWWDARSENEIDVVAISADDEVFVAKCKWGAVKAAHLDSLRERAIRMTAELPRVTRLSFGLYGGRGEFDANLRKAAERGEVHLFGPDDLIR